MDDDNVVAYIYPAVGTEGHDGAGFSIRMNQNTRDTEYLPSKRRPPQALDLLLAPVAPHRGPPDRFRRADREPTADEEEHDPLKFEACIKVTFRPDP
jgi:hypothetical protein